MFELNAYNVRSFLQQKLYFTGLKFFQSEFTIQLNIALTNQITSFICPIFNDSFSTKTGFQDPSNTKPDSTIQSSTQSVNTTRMELREVLLGIICLSIIKKKSSKL